MNRASTCAAGIIALASVSGCHRAATRAPAPIPLGSAEACIPPTPGRTWEPDVSERLSASSVSYTPAAPAALSAGYSVDRLVGRYRFTVVVTAHIRADSTAEGVLVLERTAPARNQPTDWAKAFPLWGWTDLDFDRLRLGGLPVAPSARDPRRPGVQVRIDEARRLTMTVGNSFGLEAGGIITKTTDSGVFFYAFRADDTRIEGRWGSSSLGSANPEGFFCAHRI